MMDPTPVKPGRVMEPGKRSNDRWSTRQLIAVAIIWTVVAGICLTVADRRADDDAARAVAKAVEATHVKQGCPAPQPGEVVHIRVRNNGRELFLICNLLDRDTAKSTPGGR